MFFLSSSVQIDSNIIALMHDATLENYIPCYGDRIALFNFCKSRHPVSKRKQGLLERLREKMKARTESSTESSSPPTTRASQTKKQKPTQNVEIGWIHNDGNVIKQVRAKQGGGTRKIKMATEAGLKEILLEGKNFFFLMEYLQGPECDFEFQVWDFKQNLLTADTCQSIGSMYETARLTMLRFYIATKAKDFEDDASETSEVVHKDHFRCHFTQWQSVKYVKYDGLHHSHP